MLSTCTKREWGIDIGKVFIVPPLLLLAKFCKVITKSSRHTEFSKRQRPFIELQWWMSKKKNWEKEKLFAMKTSYHVFKYFFLAMQGITMLSRFWLNSFWHRINLKWGWQTIFVAETEFNLPMVIWFKLSIMS